MLKAGVTQGLLSNKEPGTAVLRLAHAMLHAALGPCWGQQRQPHNMQKHKHNINGYSCLCQCTGKTRRQGRTCLALQSGLIDPLQLHQLCLYSVRYCADFIHLFLQHLSTVCEEICQCYYCGLKTDYSTEKRGASTWHCLASVLQTCSQLARS